MVSAWLTVADSLTGSSGSSSQLDLDPGVPPSPPHPVSGLRAQSPQESRQVSLLRTSRPPNPDTRSPLVPDRGPHCSSSESHAYGHILGLPSTRFREVILAGAPHPDTPPSGFCSPPLTLAASTPACPCRTCSCGSSLSSNSTALAPTATAWNNVFLDIFTHIAIGLFFFHEQ